MDDPYGHEFVVMVVHGSGNLYVQFALEGDAARPSDSDQMYGEVVGDAHLSTEEVRRLDRSALERLGYVMQDEGNYGQSWPSSVGLSYVARVAASGLREGHGVDETAQLVITTAHGEVRSA